MRETLTFRDLIQENLLDSVKTKFEDMIDAVQKLKDYTYEIDINFMTVKKNGKTIVNIPKKEHNEVKKWIQIIKDFKPADKTPKISDLDAELKKAFKNGRTEI